MPGREVDAAFTSLVQLHAGALFIDPDPFFISLRGQLVALASRHAVPAIYESREFAASGGLISYGPSIRVPFSSSALTARAPPKAG
jgi:putative ABC transport system substrate-binding protein